MNFTGDYNFNQSLKDFFWGEMDPEETEKFLSEARKSKDKSDLLLTALLAYNGIKGRQKKDAQALDKGLSSLSDAETEELIEAIKGKDKAATPRFKADFYRKEDQYSLVAEAEDVSWKKGSTALQYLGKNWDYNLFPASALTGEVSALSLKVEAIRELCKSAAKSDHPGEDVIRLEEVYSQAAKTSHPIANEIAWILSLCSARVGNSSKAIGYLEDICNSETAEQSQRKAAELLLATIKEIQGN